MKIREKLRKSGVDVIGDVPWGVHFCQFYRTKEDLIEILIPYFKAGLENNEFCMWVTSQPLEEEEVKESLRKTVPGFNFYLEKRQIEIISYRFWCLKDGIFNFEELIKNWIEKLNSALANGYDGFRLTGNTSWVEKKDWNAFRYYEKEADRILGNYRILSLCSYCLERCNAAEIIDVVVNHQFVLIKRTGKWEQIESSKRKEAEKALQENKQNLSYAQAVGNLGSWKLDLRKKELTWSDEHYRIIGITKSTHLTPETFISVVHPADRKYVLKKWEEGIAGKPYDIEHRILVAGKVKWVREKAFLEFDRYGIFLGGFGITQDISKRKKVEEALIQSENKFRTLAENSPDIIIRFDRQKRYIYTNPAATEPLCCSLEEIIGKTNSELGMKPENVKFWETHYENVFLTGKPEAMEFKYLSPKGKEYYFYTRVVPEFLNEEVVSVLSISRDITEIKEAETKLKKAYGNLEELIKERTIQLEQAYNSLKESETGLAEAQKMAHIGNWEWEIAREKGNWSEELYHIFGLVPREVPPDLNEYLGYVHPEDRAQLKAAFNKAIKGMPYSLDQRILLTDGEEKVVHVKSEVILNEKDIPFRLKGIVQDITERKKAEKALINFETTRKKEIHHRIKNNLQVISSLLDLQAEKFQNREQVESSEILKAVKETQDRVMSIALIHEELYEGKVKGALNISLYLQKLVKKLFQAYKIGNTDIKLDLEMQTDIFFDMDTAVPVGIILNELVSNSLKHAFQGREKGLIKIGLCREESSECREKVSEYIGSKGEEKGRRKRINFILRVQDNGVGMPQNLNLKSPETLGIQLVFALLDQISGKLELKTDCVTEFIIRFMVPENSEENLYT